MSKLRLALAFLALLAFLVWLSAGGLARAQEAEVITGQVVNGSAGGGEASGLTVVLHQVGRDLHVDREAVTDSQGRFRFDGVIPVPGLSYAVSVTYKEALYGLDLRAGSSEIPPVTLTVYEPTDNDTVLEATAISLLVTGVERRSQTVGILEIVTIRNASDRTYVPSPDPMKLLRFSLPPGSIELQVQANLFGADVLQVDKGFGLTAPVPPGEHEILFTYRFPYKEATASFTHSLPFGAGRLQVLFPDGSVQLSSPGLGRPEPVEVGGRAFLLLRASELPRGSQVNFNLEGLPKASLADRLAKRLGQVPWQLAAPASVGLLATTLVAYAFLRRRRQEAIEGASAVEAEALLQTLTALSERFAAGELDERPYHKQRLRIIRSLAGLRMMRQGALDSAEVTPTTDKLPQFEKAKEGAP